MAQGEQREESVRGRDTVTEGEAWKRAKEVQRDGRRKRNGNRADEAGLKQIQTVMKGFPSSVCHWPHTSPHPIT